MYFKTVLCDFRIFFLFFFLFFSRLPKHIECAARTMRARARQRQRDGRKLLSETEAAKISSSQTFPVRCTRRPFSRFSRTNDDDDSRSPRIYFFVRASVLIANRVHYIIVYRYTRTPHLVYELTRAEKDT